MKTLTERESLLDRAVGILKEVNEAPTPTVELSEEDTFGMVVARCLFEAKFQELNSYPTYGAPVARAAKQYFPSQFPPSKH